MGLPDQRIHLLAVGAKAEWLASILAKEDMAASVVAAHLHDIGYAPELVDTGSHQLDGARWLASLGQDRIAALVAHHSGARFELEHPGLSGRLRDPREVGVVDDALTYCDLITGPRGEKMSAAERLAEVRRRYEADSPVVRALDVAEPELLAAVARTEARLSQSKVAAGSPA